MGLQAILGNCIAASALVTSWQERKSPGAENTSRANYSKGGNILSQFQRPYRLEAYCRPSGTGFVRDHIVVIVSIADLDFSTLEKGLALGHSTLPRCRSKVFRGWEQGERQRGEGVGE